MCIELVNVGEPPFRFYATLSVSSLLASVLSSLSSFICGGTDGKLSCAFRKRSANQWGVLNQVGRCNYRPSALQTLRLNFFVYMCVFIYLYVCCFTKFIWYIHTEMNIYSINVYNILERFWMIAVLYVFVFACFCDDICTNPKRITISSKTTSWLSVHNRYLNKLNRWWHFTYPLNLREMFSRGIMKLNTVLGQC